MYVCVLGKFLSHPRVFRAFWREITTWKLLICEILKRIGEKKTTPPPTDIGALNVIKNVFIPSGRLRSARRVISIHNVLIAFTLEFENLLR